MNRPLSALTLAALCVAGVSTRGADDDLSTLQQRIDRLAALFADSGIDHWVRHR